MNPTWIPKVGSWKTGPISPAAECEEISELAATLDALDQEARLMLISKISVLRPLFDSKTNERN